MAGSIANDTQKMASYGLGDVIGMALQNEMEKEEHEREMEKLDKLAQVNYVNQQSQQNTSSGPGIDQQTLIGFGAVVLGVFAAYKLLT
jgi:hypothetical protein